MTDYRLGFRRDARHWLALAKATDREHPGGLAPEWRERIERYLGELNREVYGLGPEPGDEPEARTQ
jgi:hypothetical protein